MNIRSYLQIIIFLSFVSIVYGSSWSDGSGRTIPEKKWELGVLHTPLRYGLTDNTEISTYAVWDLFVPNFSVKKKWRELNGFILSSSHGVYSPTPLLRFVSKEKIGGLLPPDNYVPFIFVFDSYLFLSHFIMTNHMLTLKSGIKLPFAIGDKKSDHPAYQRLETIDYPFIFQRTAFLTKTPNISPEIALNMVGPLYSQFGYSAACSFFLLPIRDNLREENMVCWSIEPSALIRWNVSNRFSCHVGAIASFGNYPFGNNWTIYPLLDMAIGFGKIQ